ncbi:PREDICTED: uncharacterized protein LOC104771405 isoform X1 [Camelina sativa]|uniref:Uncharacterized protein LOC104771405 isoform X1 n=1 Tax=Camelina sativa TaxID=90675 RepID=A0ABM0Y1X1_CAMSA|nr:PREDICTED: uncharacterized protein LOC104771405 isoform X1 [Camelina sativa]
MAMSIVLSGIQPHQYLSALVYRGKDKGNVEEKTVWVTNAITEGFTGMDSNCSTFQETPQTKGRIFGLGKVAKRLRSLSYSSTLYDRDPELIRALQEKDDRIEALEKMMEKENERSKQRDEELASFMAEMRSKFSDNSSS